MGIFDPFEIRGLRLPNRVLMAPMEKNLCTADGVMTQRYVDYLVARARGGVGLLRVEATYVDPVGGMTFRQRVSCFPDGIRALAGRRHPGPHRRTSTRHR